MFLPSYFVSSQIWLNMIDQSITNDLLMTEHLFISSSYVLHFELLKNVMGALPKALKIIFEMQRKKSNEKLTRRKKNFPSYKMCVRVFFAL
jgi:hypothetical protein